MFTVGIFTTHIPYIVLVVLYAWCLLFGVSKAPLSEVEAEEKLNQTELFALPHITKEIVKAINFYDFQSAKHISYLFRFIDSHANAHWPKHSQPFLKTESFVNKLFGRPPPVI
jgi:hypothetical protein